jgi:hypothetical protein
MLTGDERGVLLPRFVGELFDAMTKRQSPETDIGALVANMRADGHELTVEGSEVKWTPPQQGAHEELRAKVVRRRDEFLAFLTNEGSVRLGIEPASIVATVITVERLGDFQRVCLEVPDDAARSYARRGVARTARPPGRATHEISPGEDLRRRLRRTGPHGSRANAKRPAPDLAAGLVARARVR